MKVCYAVKYNNISVALSHFINIFDNELKVKDIRLYEKLPNSILKSA